MFLTLLYTVGYFTELSANQPILGKHVSWLRYQGRYWDYTKNHKWSVPPGASQPCEESATWEQEGAALKQLPATSRDETQSGGAEPA